MRRSTVPSLPLQLLFPGVKLQVFFLRNWFKFQKQLNLTLLEFTVELSRTGNAWFIKFSIKTIS